LESATCLIGSASSEPNNRSLHFLTARLRDHAAPPHGAFALATELPHDPLRHRMTEDMQILSLAPCTEFSYRYEVARFARHFGGSPDLLGSAEIRTYCMSLIRDKHLITCYATGSRVSEAVHLKPTAIDCQRIVIRGKPRRCSATG
jgi:Phage integrase, N-terminal SAM-like domain